MKYIIFIISKYNFQLNFITTVNSALELFKPQCEAAQPIWEVPECNFVQADMEDPELEDYAESKA